MLDSVKKIIINNKNAPFWSYFWDRAANRVYRSFHTNDESPNSDKFGSKRDAQRILRDRLASIDKGVYLEKTNESTSEYLNRWLESYSMNVSLRTVVGYRTCIKRLDKHIGAIPLQKLRPEHIQKAYTSILQSGLSARTVLHSHRVLNKALTEAVKWGILVYNPLEAVTPPRVRKKEPSTWTPEVIRKFLNLAKNSRYYNAYRLAALTGMRRSELAGIKWGDVDLELGRLKIVRTRQRIPGHGVVVGQPKSHRSQRSIALSPVGISVLENTRSRQAEIRLKAGGAWTNTDYVFTVEDWLPIDPNSLSQEFRRIVRKYKLPYGTLHGLRHSFATSLLSANVHPAVVQSALGHSSISVTIDTYSHVMPGLEEAAARQIDEALNLTLAESS